VTLCIHVVGYHRFEEPCSLKTESEESLSPLQHQICLKHRLAFSREKFLYFIEQWLLDSDGVQCKNRNMLMKRNMLPLMELNFTYLIINHRRSEVAGLVSMIPDSGRSQWPRGLRHVLASLEHWDRMFGSCSGDGCVSAFFCVVLSCVGRGLASG
jgi:hypothetical protein